MTALEGILRRVARDLDDADVGWAILGALAVGIRSEPRFTRDVDLAVAVDDDAHAERLIHELRRRGHEVLTIVEQQATAGLATARLLVPGQDPEGRVLDLLFASSGIELEIVAAAEVLEVLPGFRAPVARTGHLIALKLLSADDSRPQDAVDLGNLLAGVEAEDLQLAREAVHLVTERGYARGRDLVSALERRLDSRR